MPDEVWIGLGRSVDAVVHELACQHLEQARTTLIRAELETDARALHDFRVATRRLRSLLESYRDALRSAARWEKSLGRLRALASLTGRARDAEAQLEWLKKHTSDEHPAVSVTRETLEERLDGIRSGGYRRARERAIPEFFALRKELVASGLGQPPAPARAEPLPEESFAHVCAEQLDQLAARLQNRLENAHRLDDEEGSHETRLEAKRLRYLLEPLRGSLGESRAAVKQLRRLQNALGELNDLRGLRTLLRATFEQAVLESAQARWAQAGTSDAVAHEPADRAVLLEEGCLELSRSVEERRRALSEALGRDWFGGRSEGFFERLTELGLTLRERAQGRSPEPEPTPPPEETRAAQPPTAPGATPAARAAPTTTMRRAAPSGFGAAGRTATPAQFKAAARRAVHGLRAARGPQGARYYRTVKQDFGGQLIEFEKVISRAEFERLRSEGERNQVRVQHRVRAPIHELLQPPHTHEPETVERPSAASARTSPAPRPPDPAPDPAPPAIRPERSSPSGLPSEPAIPADTLPEPPTPRPALPPALPSPSAPMAPAPMPALVATLGGGSQAALRPAPELGELSAAGRALLESTVSRVRAALAQARSRSGGGTPGVEQLVALGAALTLTLLGGGLIALGTLETTPRTDASQPSAPIAAASSGAAALAPADAAFSATANSPAWTLQALERTAARAR